MSELDLPGIEGQVAEHGCGFAHNTAALPWTDEHLLAHGIHPAPRGDGRKVVAGEVLAPAAEVLTSPPRESS
jgi:hypothetical protein